MRAKNAKRVAGALLTPVLLAVAAPGVAESAETAVEEITVVATPIRTSNEQALQRKRDSENVVDVVAADLIGRFPDQNLADSLGRVPGLAIERDQGQARFINFRGAPFRYTAIAFDGLDVMGAENGRIPRFDSFPSVITSAIVVNKAITADMPGEAVAGYVDVRTFDPFSFEGVQIGAEAGLGNQELGDVDIDKHNFRVSYSNDTFGAVAFLSHNKRGRITDNREMDLTETAEGIVPVNLDFRSYRGFREDNARGASLEFRPNDKTRIFFNTLYSEFIDREERNQWDFDLVDDTTTLSDATGQPVPADSGYVPVIVVTRILEDGEYTNSTFTNSLGADFHVAGWDVNARLNYTETENETFIPLPYSVGGTIAGRYDVRDVDAPVLEPFEAGTMTPVDVNTIAYAADFGLIFANEMNTDALKYRVDAARDLPFFGHTRLKVGVQFDDREGSGGDTLVFGGFPDTVDIGAFVTGNLWDSGFSNTVAGRNHDNVGLRRAWERAAGPLTFTYDDDSLVGIEEEIFAIYAMGTTLFDRGSFTYGVRIEITDYTSRGSLVNEDGVVTRVALGDNYTNILPNAHLNIDLTGDVKLRASLSSGVSRPTYTELRASTSVDVINLEIEGGNALVKPEEAWGGDLSLEYYFAPASIVSAGVFARYIDNVIYANEVTVPDGSIYAPGLIAPGTPTAFDTFFNGTDGELYGLELNLVTQLPEPFQDFGVSGNVTFLDSEFRAPTLADQSHSLPGTSDLIYNASVFFEKWGLSARINYQYRDDWLSTTENDSLTEFWAEEERLDASVRYVLPLADFDGVVTLFANFNNLTDFVDVRYTRTRRTPNQVEGFGERWLVGVRVDY